jgi:hypothetical protein
MKRSISVLTVLLIVASAASPLAVAAQAATHVDGGGTAAGVDTMSQFGIGVMVNLDGTTGGHFTCVMAGRSAMTAMGLSLMAVKGDASRGTVTGDSVSFDGVGTLTMKSTQSSASQVLTEAFTVKLMSGGAGTGTLALDVPGVGFSMTETVTSGQIAIH